MNFVWNWLKYINKNGISCINYVQLNRQTPICFFKLFWYKNLFQSVYECHEEMSSKAYLVKKHAYHTYIRLVRRKNVVYVYVCNARHRLSWFTYSFIFGAVALLGNEKQQQQGLRHENERTLTLMSWKQVLIRNILEKSKEKICLASFVNITRNSQINDLKSQTKYLNQKYELKGNVDVSRR